MMVSVVGVLIAMAAFWFQSDPSKWPAFIRAPIEKFVEPRKNERIILDVNTATQWELQCIPGVGETVAKQIIKDRPFANFEDLDRVYGVGPVTLGNLRKHVRIGTNEPASSASEKIQPVEK